MKQKSHCVFIHTTLKYDGRVCALINTLSSAFPEDKIYIYGVGDNSDIQFSNNVHYSNLAYISVPKLRILVYSIFAFFVLLYRHPKTIQIHHETVLFGPLCYMFLNRKMIVIYDDKELYHPRDKNTTLFLFRCETLLIKRVNLVIFTNEFRKRAIQIILKQTVNNIIVENFVFDPSINELDEGIVQQVKDLQSIHRKILLHQGVIDYNRGASELVLILDRLPEDWVLVFIGVNNLIFNNFNENLTNKQRSKIRNFGYIPYDQLNAFWLLVDASVNFYNSDTYNNKFCAPNRLYSSANAGVPMICNGNNVTLRTFIEKYFTGILIPPIDEIDIFFNNYEKYHVNAQCLKGKFQYMDGIIKELEDYYLSLN